MAAEKKQVRDQPETIQKLYKAACEARERSYSPYSKHKVGAAMRLSDGRIFTGCNVENSSYGGTICAERTAAVKAVSETAGPVRIEEVLVVTDSATPWPPCGFCRQFMAEFASPDMPVHSTNLQGEMRSSRFGDLFPDAFTPDFLGK